MNIRTTVSSETKPPATNEEFLRWNEGREGKREFVRGRVVEMMINVTRNHARISAMLLMALGRKLDLNAYDIGSADFGVKTDDGVRFPDVYIDRRSEQSAGDDLAATTPVMLAEILSQSSYNRDFVEKLADYQSIPSLRHYVILSQDEPRAWLWNRVDRLGWIGPVELVGIDATLDLSEFGITLPLAELYDGIETRR